MSRNFKQLLDMWATAAKLKIAGVFLPSSNEINTQAQTSRCITACEITNTDTHTKHKHWLKANKQSKQTNGNLCSACIFRQIVCLTQLRWKARKNSSISRKVQIPYYRPTTHADNCWSIETRSFLHSTTDTPWRLCSTRKLSIHAFFSHKHYMSSVQSYFVVVFE